MSAAPPMRPRVHVAAAVAVIVLLAAAIATTAEARHQHHDHAHPHHDHHNRDYHTHSHGDRHPGGRVVVTRDADSPQAGAPRHPGMAKDGRLRRDATSAAAVTAVIARDINQALMPVEGKLIRLAKLDRSQQEWRRGLEAWSAHEEGQLQESSAPRGDARSHTHSSPTPHSHARAPGRAHEQRQSRCDHGAMSAHTCGDDNSHRDHAHPQAGTAHRRDQGSDAATEHADADNTRFRSAMLHDLVNTVRAMQHRHNELQDDVNALARELHSRASSRDEWRELRHHINMVDEQVDRRLTSTGDRVEGELRRMRDYMEVLESRCTRADARSDDAFTPRFDRARGTTDGARGLDSGDGDGGGSEPWYHDVVEGSVWLALFLIGVCVIFNTLATAVMVATKGVWSLVVGSVHVWYWLVRAWRLLRRVRVRCALTRVPRTREGAAAGAAGGADGAHPASSDHDDDNGPGDDGKADKPKDGCDNESNKTDTSDATGATTTTTTTTAAAATNSTPATTAAASTDASSGESDSSVLGSFQLRFSFGFAPEESTASGAAAAADTVAEAAADGAGGDDDADDAGSTGTASKSEKQEAAAATETASTAAPSATTATAAASATAATVTGGGDACERTADTDTDAYNDNDAEEAGAGSDDTAADASA